MPAGLSRITVQARQYRKNAVVRHVVLVNGVRYILKRQLAPLSIGSEQRWGQDTGISKFMCHILIESVFNGSHRAFFNYRAACFIRRERHAGTAHLGEIVGRHAFFLKHMPVNNLFFNMKIVPVG